MIDRLGIVASTNYDARPGPSVQEQLVFSKMMYEKLFDLTGKVALVTGGSRGLGKAMARAYAENGANILVCSRGEAQLRAAAAEIGAGLEVRVEWIQADMSLRGEAERVAEAALSRLGRVDVLVNNAGGSTPQRPHEITDEAWDRNLEVNLSAAMRLTRALLPQMMERRWGRVIHVSSILGLGGRKERNVYGAAKAALIGMTKASALDLAPYGITVNCLAPGPILTERQEGVLSDEDKRSYSERTAFKRMGRPPEIAGPALLLGTDAGSFITGTALVVDGGVMANVL